MVSIVSPVVELTVRHGTFTFSRFAELEYQQKFHQSFNHVLTGLTNGVFYQAHQWYGIKPTYPSKKPINVWEKTKLAREPYLLNNFTYQQVNVTSASLFQAVGYTKILPHQFENMFRLSADSNTAIVGVRENFPLQWFLQRITAAVNGLQGPELEETFFDTIVRNMQDSILGFAYNPTPCGIGFIGEKQTIESIHYNLTNEITQ